MLHPRFHSSPKFTESMSHVDRHDVRRSDMMDETMSVSDLEGETIIKQRRELQLLIGELKDRDRELNEMVSAHQQQLSAWERDREKVLDLEQKNERLESEIRKRNEQLRLLIQRLKVSECRQKNKDSVIEVAKTKLVQAEKVINETSAVKNDLKSMNDVLNSSLSEMSSKIGRLEAKEQEFVTQLQLKDGDLVEAESEMSELKSKLRRMETEIKEYQRDGANVRVDLEQQRAKFRQCRAELDKMSAEMATKTGELIALRQELAKVRDDIHRVKRELYLSEEQVKRKEELIELQKSKQERADVELSQLRQLYERQQEELSLLQLNLESSQEMLAKQEERLNHMSYNSLDLDGFECSSQTTNDLLEEARKSAEEDPLLLLGLGSVETKPGSPRCRSDLGHIRPTISSISPTSKLQRLLTESREMVHDLERTAHSPPTRTPYQHHNFTRHTF